MRHLFNEGFVQRKEVRVHLRKHKLVSGEELTEFLKFHSKYSNFNI